MSDLIQAFSEIVSYYTSKRGRPLWSHIHEIATTIAPNGDSFFELEKPVIFALRKLPRSVVQTGLSLTLCNELQMLYAR